MSDLTFELTEFFQKRELRLKAALKFLERQAEINIPLAIKLADELLAKLDETEK